MWTLREFQTVGDADGDLSGRFFPFGFKISSFPAVIIHQSVPQGSVLGTLLFILYVADAADKHELGSHFYADDVQLSGLIRQVGSSILYLFS